MSFPRYDSYRDSGVEWLGEVPSDWAVDAIKRHFQVVGGSTPKSDVAEYWDGRIPWVTPSDLGRLDGLIATTGRTITEEGLNSCAASLVPAGTVILSTRAPIGSLGTTAVEACTNQGCRSLVRRGPVREDYLAQVLSIAVAELNMRGKGTTFLELSGDELGSFKIPIPSSREQDAIISFLDRETAKIDTLVDEQRRLIELLKEKRQAVISHAVTKGLDPSVPMTDSGVEWLREVPRHWEVSALKRITEEITVGIVVEPSKYYVDEGVPALRSLNVRSGNVRLEDLVYISAEANDLHSKSKLRQGDLVAVRTGQPGTAAIVPPELDGCNCVDLIIIRPSIDCNERFLCWYLASDAARFQFSEGSGGAIQQHFNVGEAKELRISLASIAEQISIADYLDRETEKLDELSRQCERAIDLLLEHRTALISAAVTGKINVRGAVVHEPELEVA